MKNKVIELIESTPTINGLKSNGEKIDLIDEYSRELFGKGIENRKCGSCVLKAFDDLRVYAGYEPLKRKESKNITKARLKICYNCDYLVKDGLSVNVLGVEVKSDTCGPLANKVTKRHRTKDGVLLCSCVVSKKAELRPKMLKLLGGCPAGFWDNIE